MSLTIRRSAVRAILFSVTVLFGTAHHAQASAIACPAGTLDNYINLLPADGCFIGSTVFSGFSLLSLPFGSTQIDDTKVQITPTSGASTVSLLFSLTPTVTADAPTTMEFLVGYNVTGGVTKASIALAGAAATDDASVTALMNYCVGSSFSVFCPGLATAVFDPGLGIDTVNDSTLPFAPTALLGIVTDVAIGAAGVGGVGAASLSGPVTNQFNVAPQAAPVPEPATLLLISTGLAVSRLRRSRTRT